MLYQNMDDLEKQGAFTPDMGDYIHSIYFRMDAGINDEEETSYIHALQRLTEDEVRQAIREVVEATHDEL